MPLKTLPTDPAIRPGFETEQELARILWAAQRTLGEAVNDLCSYSERGGDLHGGDQIVDLIVMDGVGIWLRELARRLDRTVGDD